MQSLSTNTNRRILVIDDNRSIHDDFRKILVADEVSEELKDAEGAFFGETHNNEESFNFELHSAYQGEEALHKVVAGVEGNCPYALAFVDMRMPPGWDGLTTIEQLWMADADLQVVICTAYSDHSWADISRRLGDSDRWLILKKPFDNAEVCQLALGLTEKWNLAQQARLRRVDLERLVEERTAQLRDAEASVRQKQKLEAIGALAGGVAHEFNNLLQIIREYSRFAMEALAPDAQPHHDLTHVVEASDRAATITHQLLNFSRKRPVRKSYHCVNEILSATVKMVQPVLGERIDVQLELGPNAGTICGDAEILSQAVLNLCINARDAMPDGGDLLIRSGLVAIADRRGRAASPEQPLIRPGDYAVITVADNGCGIPAELTHRIFDPFFTTKEVGRASGLGLAMVFGVTENHDGRVTVESKEGEGSAFRLFLPAAKGATAGVLPPKTRSDTAVLIGGETILVAEDEMLVREVAVRTLAKAGYRVITAVDGEDAVKTFEDHADTIQVAVLDAIMPKLNGHQVYDRIMAQDPTMKIVFCTGYDAKTANLQELIEQGLSVVEKPYDARTLLRAVRQSLDGSIAANVLAPA